MFVGNRRMVMVSTNDAYHKLTDKHKCIEERVIKIWGFHKPIPYPVVPHDPGGLVFSIDATS